MNGKCFIIFTQLALIMFMPNYYKGIIKQRTCYDQYILQRLWEETRETQYVTVGYIYIYVNCVY